MTKIKLRLKADEFRLLHDVTSHILQKIDIRKSLRNLSDFVVLQRLLQKKMAAKVVMLQKENSVSFTVDEAVAFYIHVNEINVVEFDEFSGAVICSIISEIEPKICQPSAKEIGTPGT